MEVLHHPSSFYMPQTGMLCTPTLEHILTKPDDFNTYYFVNTSSSPSQPFLQQPCRAYMKHGPYVEAEPEHVTTLQSVLRGKIPPAYSHLAVNTSHQFLVQSKASPGNSNNQYLEQDILFSALSPCGSSHSSLSPRPSSNESQTSVDSNSDCQTEPMDLSCKKSLQNKRAASVFPSGATSGINSSIRSVSLPAQLNSSWTSFESSLSSSSSSPALLSQHSPPPLSSLHTFLPSPAESNSGEFSLLRNLLSVGKHNHHTSSDFSHSTPNLSPERVSDSPASDSFRRTPVTGNTKVQLAKKNLLPVSARISDWLFKFVNFAKSIPEFSTLSDKDKITLIQSSWSRALLLYMAESNFQFAVTPSVIRDSQMSDVLPSQDEPTMKSVESLQTFIRKCQHMSVDSEEYKFLRMLVLFNSGYPGLDCPERIEDISSVVQQLLQQHIKVSRPGDLMHYSRLLMCLPSLYATRNRMFEALFCNHITKDTDMEAQLKELLESKFIFHPSTTVSSPSS